MLLLWRSQRVQSLMGIGLTAVLGVLGFALLARGLSEGELGQWAFFLMLYTLFDVFRSGLVSNGLIKLYNETEDIDRRRRIRSAAFELSWGISLLAAMGAVLCTWVFRQSWGVYALPLGLAGALSALGSVPYSLSLWSLNAQSRYREILYLRLVLQLPVFVTSVLIFYHALSWMDLVWIYAGSHVLASGLSAFFWEGWPRWFKFWTARNERRELLQFGRYSVGTVLGSSLLKSSDGLMLMPILGPAAVAAYNVPERLLGLLEIPVRSFIQTAYPRLVRIRQEMESEFAASVQKETGLLFVLLIPFVVLVWLFAPTLVVMLGGEQYRESAPVLQFFAVYMALIPFDRLSGIALDAYGRPQWNLVKVIGMLVVNLVGDWVVLRLGGGIREVAAVSVLTFGSGIAFGYFFLKDKLQFSLFGIVADGWKEALRLGRRFTGQQQG